MKQNKPDLTKKDIEYGLGKLPPQATEIEEAVLGAMMIEKDCLFQVSGILRPEDFYREAHSNIYRTILDLFQNGQPVDILTVTQHLRKNGLLEMVGGPYYVTELTTKVNSASNVETHSRIIAEYALKRDLLRLCSEAIHMCYDDQEDAFICKEYLDAGLIKLDAGIESSKIKSIKEITAEVLTDVATAMKIPDGITGVPSGFSAVDKLTGGWQNSDLIIIAARPGMGKTALVVCNACNSAIRYKKKGAIFSLEMSAKQLVSRMITSELDYLDLSTDKLRRGKITQEQLKGIHEGIQSLISSNIYIDDTPALSITRLRSKAYFLKRKYDIQWLIVDYLQLMRGDTSKGSNREQEIAAISRGLKTLAKELEIPIIALSQLSRAVETRGGDKRPQLSDLRESGAIEQDADVIVFIYRAEYYGITQDSEGFPTAGLGELIFAKHRSGALEDIVLRFESRKTKFRDNINDMEPSSAFDFGSYRKPYPETDASTAEEEDRPF